MKCGNRQCTQYADYLGHNCKSWNTMLSKNCGFFEECSCVCNPCMADEDCPNWRPKYDVNPCAEIDFDVGLNSKPIEIRIEDIEIYMEEYKYMEWMMKEIDFGPAHEDVIQILHRQYEKETGNKVPDCWK